MTERLKTRISTKGQVVLPKSLRERRGWRPGDELVIQDTTDGVTLRPASNETPTRMEDVFGCLDPVGKAATIEEMDAAVDLYIRERWGREYDDLD